MASCSAAETHCLSEMSTLQIVTVTGLLTISTGPSRSHSDVGKTKNVWGQFQSGCICQHLINIRVVVYVETALDTSR